MKAQYSLGRIFTAMILLALAFAIVFLLPTINSFLPRAEVEMKTIPIGIIAVAAFILGKGLEYLSERDVFLNGKKLPVKSDNLRIRSDFMQIVDFYRAAKIQWLKVTSGIIQVGSLIILMVAALSLFLFPYIW